MCVSECCLGNCVDMVGVALCEVARLLHLTPQPHQHHLHTHTGYKNVVLGLTKKTRIPVLVAASRNSCLNQSVHTCFSWKYVYLLFLIFLGSYFCSTIELPTLHVCRFLPVIFQSRQLLLMILEHWANSCFFWLSRTWCSLTSNNPAR